MTVHEAISRALGEEITVDTPDTNSESCATRRTCRCSHPGNVGQVVLEMYERLAEKQTVEPTFYRDLPGRGVAVTPASTAPSRGWRNAGTWWRSARSSGPATRSWSTGGAARAA